MPYKHIAAHLNKTELACRLHYHQICHGTNRRKRNLSTSSVHTDYSHILRDGSSEPVSRMSPASASSSGSIRLPSIMDHEKLPSLLPKPSSNDALTTMMGAYPAGQRMLPAFEHPNVSNQSLFKLNTNLPSVTAAPSHNATHVDLARLHAIYAAHRNTFWAAIAHEYGCNMSPASLENAWKTGRCCDKKTAPHHQGTSPMITPSASPVSEARDTFPTMSDRCAWDRDMIRRMDCS